MITLLSAIVLVVSCTCITKTLTIKNDSKNDLSDKVVVLTRSQVEQSLGHEVSGLVYAKSDKDIYATQCDDLDGDGKWDEVAFLINLKAGESKQIELKEEATEEDMPVFMKRTNIRFGHVKEPYEDAFGEQRLKSNDSPTISEIYQMEGPAWENDKVGFRNYYDARNGIDIFGKKVSTMVLDSVGIRGQYYHEMDSWGMDILKVANSLGAGAIAIGVGDSIYRVGPCEEGDVRMITEGPVRAILEFTFKGVPAGDRLYNVTHQITLNAGDNYYTASVAIDGLQGDENLVTGIVNKHECPLLEESADHMRIFATLGPQAFTDEYLGLGLIIPDDEYVYNKLSPMEGDGITETYLVGLKISENSKTKYSFFSGWEYQDEGFKDQGYFLEQLKNAALKISSKISVK